MSMRTHTITSSVSPVDSRRIGGLIRASVSDGQITVYRSNFTSNEEAEAFTKTIRIALTPPRFRFRKLIPYTGLAQVRGCSTEFELRLVGRNWIVSDDDGRQHRSTSLRSALLVGARAMSQEDTHE